MYQPLSRRIATPDPVVSLGRPKVAAFDAVGRMGSHSFGDYALTPEQVAASSPRPLASPATVKSIGAAVQPAQLRRKKKPFIDKKKVVFKGSLGQFHQWHDGRVAAATKIQRWLRRPTMKNKMDLVGWRPAGGGHGHMTYRRHWGEKHPGSGEHPFEDIRQGGTKQYFPKESSGRLDRGFNSLRMGIHPSDAEHRERMAGRPRPGSQPGARYDQTTSTRAILSPLERIAVNRHLKEADAYHLYGEARGEHCNTARCMSPAELLLERRGKPMPEGLYEPHELVDHFAGLNPDSTGRVEKKTVEDPGAKHEFWKNALGGEEEEIRKLPEEFEEKKKKEG